MTLFSELQDLMVTHRFRPNPRFSQNFIIDEDILEKIVNEGALKKKDTTLEIGCGTGFLTERLLEKCLVIGIENEESMIPVLEEKFSKNKGFTLIGKDFLTAKIPKFNKVVSLPPYGISSEIMLKLFDSAPEKIVIVFQREFTEKLVAEPGFKEYNYLSVLASLLYNAKIVIRNIPQKSFFPKPDSYSSLIVLDAKKKKPKINLPKFTLFLKSIFRYRNKNLRNSLEKAIKQMHGVKINKSGLKEVLLDDISSEKVSLLYPEELLEIFRKLC